MTSIRIHRESVELVALTVAADGVAVTDYEVQVTPERSRPTGTWSDPTTAGDDTGVLISGLDPGEYVVWVRYTANPETPVVRAATVRIT